MKHTIAILTLLITLFACENQKEPTNNLESVQADRLKIQNKLTVSFLLISFVSLLTACLFSYSNARHTLHQSFVHHLESVAFDYSQAQTSG